MRRLVGGALLLAVAAAGCGQDQDAEISALQERIAELEAQTTRTTTTVQASVTTTSTTLESVDTSATIPFEETLCYEYGSKLMALRFRFVEQLDWATELLQEDNTLEGMKGQTGDLYAASTEMLLIAVETKDLGFGTVDAFAEMARKLYLVALDFSEALEWMADGIESDNGYTWDRGVAEWNKAQGLLPLPALGLCEDWEESN